MAPPSQELEPPINPEQFNPNSDSSQKQNALAGHTFERAFKRSHIGPRKSLVRGLS
jgi:hypothetical protein